MHPLEGYGDLCHRYGSLFLVDTVASIGGAPFHADESKVKLSLFSNSILSSIANGVLTLASIWNDIAIDNACKSGLKNFGY